TGCLLLGLGGHELVCCTRLLMTQSGHLIATCLSLKALAQGYLLAPAPTCSLIAILWFSGSGRVMANLDFGTTPVIEPTDTKIFGTADNAVQFEKLFADDVSLQRAPATLQRGTRFAAITSSSLRMI